MKYSLFFLLLLSQLTDAQTLRRRTVTLMGSRFDLTIVDKDSLSAENAIDRAIAEITRIENLISEWRPETEVSQVNQNAGIAPVKVSEEVFRLTERALYFSEISSGAFDISFAAADRIWKFDGSMTEMPSPEKIKESVSKIGYQNIILDKKNQTIFLKLPGMKIGFGSIGKGYAADKTKELLISQGVAAGIINASGDLNSWGTQPNGKPWTAGITNPADGEVLAIVPLKKPAVVTSGNYEKFAMLDGKRYSHIINPTTGYPASGLSSVTIFADSAELANGFSTAIMVLGADEGMKLLKRFPNLQAVLITDEGKIIKTKKLKLKRPKR